ncbi:HBL/NHE enterotoxin family protein [Bacillus cereus group sp. N6]|uniref:HBL/NHE enterotoxin family protein n=1 Tax=Bacillus cereus group sp. N6 TaxID=2794583 RepID=UPI0018F54954|nr:HBL/NHE enterotoxin family protein [Bacillus cereus group sp. N6]MBJ8113794.1 HBL/NHE enterotoxin family protein [Bacillus cereus group sp. N6]
MLKKLPYRAMALSTILAISATTISSPATTFASGIEQSNTENEKLSGNTDKMKQTLVKASAFAQSMNLYSYMLLKNPDVNFAGLDSNKDLAGHGDLPNKLLQDQQKAREHASTWDTKVKRQLIDTLTGIITFDTTFQEYYQYLVNAINTGDKETLKEGIEDLQTDVKTNKQYAVSLIQALTELRKDVSNDGRVFQDHQTILSSILSSKTAGIEADEAHLKEIMESIRHFRQVESDGYQVVSWPAIGTWIAGGVMIATAKINLGQLNPAFEGLNQTIDQKRAANRVVFTASQNVSEMTNAINDAVKSLQYMVDQWNDLDSQYAGVLQSIEKADEKATANRFAFLKPMLDTAKDSWKTLKTDADTLKEGLKELKIEPVNTQK